MTYRVVLFLCKLLPVMGILITTTAVAGKRIPLIPDLTWSEEVIPTCMSCMAVLSAALAARGGARIRTTVFDQYLPPKLVRSPGIVADLAVLTLAVIMITAGWKYTTGIRTKGTYVSMPRVSRLWMYFPVPLAGMAMLVFEIKVLHNHAKSFFVEEGME